MESSNKTQSRSQIPILMQQDWSPETSSPKTSVPMLKLGSKQNTRASLLERERTKKEKKEPNSDRPAAGNPKSRNATDKKIREIEMKYVGKKNKYTAVKEDIFSKKKQLESLKNEMIGMRQQILNLSGQFSYEDEHNNLIAIEQFSVSSLALQLEEIWNNFNQNVLNSLSNELKSNGEIPKYLNSFSNIETTVKLIVADLVTKCSDMKNDYNKKIEELKSSLKAANAKNDSLNLRLKGMMETRLNKYPTVIIKDKENNQESSMELVKELEGKLAEQDLKLVKAQKEINELTEILKLHQKSHLADKDDIPSLGGWTSWELKLLKDLDETRSTIREKEIIIASFTDEKNYLLKKLAASDEEIEKMKETFENEMQNLQKSIGEENKSASLIGDQRLQSHLKYLRDQVSEMEFMVNEMLNLQNVLTYKRCEVEERRSERKSEISRMVIDIMKDRQSDVDRINRIVAKLEKHCKKAEHDHEKLERRLQEMKGFVN